MQDVAVEVVSIADACLGGLRGRSALVIGPDGQRRPYVGLLKQAGMKYVYQEETTYDVSSIIPHIQLLIHAPALAWPRQVLTAGAVARGCTGRRTPLLIFDLADYTSVEELAGLLPAVCLYTPEDLRQILPKLVKIHS